MQGREHNVPGPALIDGIEFLNISAVSAIKPDHDAVVANFHTVSVDINAETSLSRIHRFYISRSRLFCLGAVYLDSILVGFDAARGEPWTG